MYAKYIDNLTIEFAPQNKNGIMNYNLDIYRLIEDGYKEYIEAESPILNRHNHLEYEETEDNIIEKVVYDETQEEADTRNRKLSLEKRIMEIDAKIMELNNMVINELLFGNEQNVEIYKEVIQGLKNTRDNL